MDRQPHLSGRGLELRPLRENDWDALYAIASDPLLWEQHPMNDRWREEVYSEQFEQALECSGALAVIASDTEAVIGSSQYRPTHFDREAVEIGWTFLSREYWGSGTNEKLKRLMLEHALASIPRVIFRIGESNWRSRKAVEKIGGRLTDMTDATEYNGRSLRHAVYEITRESFANGPLSGI